jgi:hypothetical protein
VHGDWERAWFSATAVNAEPVGGRTRRGDRVSAHLWVIVDGEARFVARDVNAEDGRMEVNVAIGAGDRFLTLAATDVGNGYNLRLEDIR